VGLVWFGLVQHNRQLRVLYIGDNQIDAAGATALAHELKVSGGVNGVDSNYLAPFSFLFFVPRSLFFGCVQHNTSLEELVLQTNAIGTDGAKALAEALQVTREEWD
jgi:hypothetical protein